MNRLIVVPSRERARWLLEKPHTLGCLEGLRPLLFVRKDDSQLDEYKVLAARHDAELVVYDASKVKNWADTIDQIMLLAVASHADKLVIFDDDATLATPNPVMGGTVYVKARGEYLSTMIDICCDTVCDMMPAMTWPQVYNRTQDTLLSFTKPMMVGHVLDVRHFERHPEHWLQAPPPIRAYADYRMALRLGQDGFLTGLSTTLLLSHKFNLPGGGKVYRTMQVEEEGAKQLCDEFPHLVTLGPRVFWRKNEEGAAPTALAPKIKWREVFRPDKFRERFSQKVERNLVTVMDAQDAKYSLLKHHERLYSSAVAKYISAKARDSASS